MLLRIRSMHPRPGIAATRSIKTAMTSAEKSIATSPVLRLSLRRYPLPVRIIGHINSSFLDGHSDRSDVHNGSHFGMTVKSIRPQDAPNEKPFLSHSDHSTNIVQRFPAKSTYLRKAIERTVAVIFLFLAGSGVFISKASAMPVADTPMSEISNRNEDGGSNDSSTDQNTADDQSSTKKRSKKESAQDRAKKRRDQERTITKKGKKINPYKSFVPDPNDLPDPSSPDVKKVMSMWRMDRLKDLTYTQFWQLVRDGHIEKVRYSKDQRTLRVWVMDSAPGGARECKIGLPYDPNLFSHLLKHDVYIQAEYENPLRTVLFLMLRMTGPLVVSYALVQFCFRIGKRGSGDDMFGGASASMLKPIISKVDFSDIAGINEIKEELTEIIAFLKNPKKYTDMGAKSPAGILLVGAPGTGKTLLAKTIAGESRVPFFMTAGTEFSEMYVGVGASRVREIFQKARSSAPCILFIDEFDAIGQQRSAEGTDESVNTINQLLTELDGFEDNTGVIVIAATNRPRTLDMALTRPGRFDRIINLTFPNVDSREDILKLHSRDKIMSKDIDFNKVSRATAGFTGAKLMSLINHAAVAAVGQNRKVVTEMDIFDAIEKMIMTSRIQEESYATYEDEIVPDELRRAIAVYESGKVLIALMCPDYEEVYKVSVCPSGLPTGSTLFLPREEHLESRVLTRGYMETKLVVCLAGRCAERLLLGDANISTAGAADINLANAVAREMIYCCGFSKHLGPVPLIDKEDSFIAEKFNYKTMPNVSTDIARIAFEECRELLDAAEAKAYYGLATNFPALEAMVDLVIDNERVSRSELDKLVEEYKLLPFKSSFIKGYGWDEDGRLIYPGDGRSAKTNGTSSGPASVKRPGVESWWDPANPYKVRLDLESILESKFGPTATEQQ